jgi:hypothetical protein
MSPAEWQCSLANGDGARRRERYHRHRRPLPRRPGYRSGLSPSGMARGVPWPLQAMRNWNCRWSRRSARKDRGREVTAEDTFDHPLSCNWRPTDPDAFAVLNLPPTRSKAAAITRTQIIAEAFVVGRADPGAWISYSRRRAFYAARQRYWPVPYSYDTVVPTVDQLAALGIVEHQKAATGERGWQSRFKASVELIQRLSAAPVTILHDPHELIVSSRRRWQPNRLS